MTEPSKVIHVRNVGHEISEVCYLSFLLFLFSFKRKYEVFLYVVIRYTQIFGLLEFENFFLNFKFLFIPVSFDAYFEIGWEEIMCKWNKIYRGME